MPPPPSQPRRDDAALAGIKPRSRRRARPALRGLRRVYAVEPDALRPNPERVAVGNRRARLKCRRRLRRPRRGPGRGRRQQETLKKTSEPGMRPKRWRPSRRVARPSIGRHGGSYERSKLVGPGTVPGRTTRMPPAKGYRESKRDTCGVGAEPEARPEGARTAGRKEQEGQRWPRRSSSQRTGCTTSSRISEPLTIGKHAWRLVQYRGLENPLRHRRGDQDWRVRRDARDLRRLRVAAA